MGRAATEECRRSDDVALPEYAAELDAFHRAFASELKAIVESLPITNTMHVLDMACGDGFYTGLLIERLGESGRVTAVDINAACIAAARRRLEARPALCATQFVLASLEEFVGCGESFDFVWCAQSLFSLPDPVEALCQIRAVLRPGGFLAVLENDTLHQLLLPWPTRLEIALRAAELVELNEHFDRPAKFYIGRHLPALLASAGIEPLGFRTECFDRRAPLGGELEFFLQAYLERLGERATKKLPRSLSTEFEQLTDPAHERYLLRQPWLTLTWLNMLTWGRRL
jgi:SAM-dependent methyltransferase